MHSLRLRKPLLLLVYKKRLIPKAWCDRAARPSHSKPASASRSLAISATSTVNSAGVLQRHPHGLESVLTHTLSRVSWFYTRLLVIAPEFLHTLGTPPAHDFLITSGHSQKAFKLFPPDPSEELLSMAALAFQKVY